MSDSTQGCLSSNLSSSLHKKYYHATYSYWNVALFPIYFPPANGIFWLINFFGKKAAVPPQWNYTRHIKFKHFTTKQIELYSPWLNRLNAYALVLKFSRHWWTSNIITAQRICIVQFRGPCNLRNRRGGSFFNFEKTIWCLSLSCPSFFYYFSHHKKSQKRERRGKREPGKWRGQGNTHTDYSSHKNRHHDDHHHHKRSNQERQPRSL